MTASFVAERSTLRETLITTTLIQVVATGAALALAPIAPLAARDIGAPPSAIGYQISLIYLAGAFGSAWAGGWIGRFGALAVEKLALLLFAAGMAAMALANIPAVILGSALIGIGYGIQNPASAQILGAVAPPGRRNVIFSVKQAGVPVGAVLVSLALPNLDRMIGWRPGLAILALLPALLAIYLQLAHPQDEARQPSRPQSGETFFRQQRRIWQRPEWRALAFVCLAFSAIQLSLSAFAVLTLLETGRFTPLTAAAAGGVMQLFGAVGRIWWGWCSDRVGSGFSVLAVIGLIGAVAMLALTGLSSLPFVLQIALMAVLGFCLSGWNGVAIAEMTRHCAADEAGGVVGNLLFYTFLGVIIGPSLFAIVYGLVGSYALTFAGASAIMAVGAGVAILPVWRRRRPCTGVAG